MIVGIVGSEEAKFTNLGKIRATDYIKNIVNDPQVTEVVSGGCHLGGIDIWTEEITKEVNKQMTVFLPYGHFWSTGFKPRNEKIGDKSDIVYCITVDKLPDEYTGMKFDYCYHCEKYNVIPYPIHIKSGGCWTMWYAINKGKQGKLIVVHNY